jgi:hypothetical protein
MRALLVPLACLAVALAITTTSGRAAAQDLEPPAAPPDAPLPPELPLDAPAPETPPAGSPEELAPQPGAAPSAPAPALPVALPAAPPEPAAATAEPALKLTPSAYVEVYYAYNFGRPSNAITNYRGFDNRHATFSLSNAVLGGTAETGPVTTKVLLQIGSTPSTYYGSEPGLAGAGGANATDAELWKYLQEANIGWNAPVGRGLLLEAGLVGSPIGIESFAVKDNWNWSRSNLFFGLPFYHTGVRATYGWTERLTTTLAVFNGWNSVVDNNEAKSVQTSVGYGMPGLEVQALYFGGVERPRGAPEGPYWRHHFDLFGQVDATRWLAFAAQVDHGWEPNRIGTASWTSGAVYTRVKPAEFLAVALRGDRFHEHLATGGGRASEPLFWGGVEWVSSFTATIDVRPHDNLSVRLEYRHDQADAPLYFRGQVEGSGDDAAPFVPNARSQDTVLLGATAWL